MTDREKTALVIVGPTASGKSDLAILLARKYQGEIISADSRQVYQGMDIGAGKVSKDEQRLARHWLLDVASPKRSYNVTHFVRDAKQAVQDIEKRKRLPILCGGTAFWIQAFLEGTAFPEVKPHLELRKKLEKKTAEELFLMLEKKDPRRAQNIDPHNKIRLIRALEIIETLGKVPLLQPLMLEAERSLIIALNPPKEVLHANIEKRLEKRLKEGMIEEIERLHSEDVSWQRLESFGLEYKNIALYLQRKISHDEMEERILIESRQYVKRQLSFLRRWEKQGARLLWVKNQEEAVGITRSIFS